MSVLSDLDGVLGVFTTLAGIVGAAVLPWWWVPVVWAGLIASKRCLVWVRHRHWAHGAQVVEILPPPTAEIHHAEAFWTQMLGLLRPAWKRALFGQPQVAWEYVIDQAGLRIRVWVPGGLPPRMVSRAVEATWPGASTTTSPADAASFTGVGRGGMLRLARPDHYPLATSHEEDPLRGLIGAAASPAEGETILVQVIARPVTGVRLHRANQAAANLRSSHSVTSRVFDTLTPGGGRGAAGWAALRPEVSGEIRAILAKSVRPRLETVVRHLVTTPGSSPSEHQRRRGRIHAITGAFSAFSAYNHYRRRRTPLVADRLAELRFLRRGDLLSVAELAAVAHLPLDEAVPGLERAPAKPVPPPPGLAGDDPDARVLGTSDAGPGRVIGQRAADARHHTHIIGGTGTGKTSLLLNMALDDIAKGRGVVFIEPKGESTLLLSRMPEEAIERVVLIDPDDNAPPPTLNPLAVNDQGRSADTITGIFKRIFADSWGPRTEDILRSACLTLAGTPDAGLANIPRLLENASFRARTVAQVTDPVLQGFWQWFDEQSGPARSHAIAPLMNKLRSVLLRGFARDLLAATDRGLDLRAHLDNSGVVIARLPKGVLGEDTSSLLGSLLLSQVWNAVLARARQAESDRADLAIYLDECQNFLTLPYGIGDMLAEARAYGAGMVLAHQDLAQLPRDLREAISANARNKVFFDVSPEDARVLARHVRPHLGEHDLSHLAAFQAGARLVHHGALTPAFTLRTRPLPPPIKGRATAVRKTARVHVHQ
ncbi:MULTISPECIES: type IV secretory system conjugative DNA transfer family protein [Nocardiopsis]|uniref:Type IV secretion system DNA-binding domain-containing protein n=1 Tax=Nocardiopsis tropica TaxID=109330 RepID=A0ABU7KSU8_9ACTN|nr:MULTISPECIES: type IV secretion system DNA-binding domain-containing protein [Nocardiopsis]MCK9873058.1 type IV secretion system DNA-binding domain-containing protein [Nocardiopsis dassonvillei]MEE2052064.1 type IV secretion system DNA-binding domain-containing protein [Nocardiopsis umidischolae]